MNAQRIQDTNLYQYYPASSTSNIRHRTSSPDGECLTYQTDSNGALLTVGVDCNTLVKPLCMRRSAASTTTAVCDCPIVKCSKWEDLYDSAAIAGGNPTISGAKVCVEPCDSVTKANADANCKVICQKQVNLKAYLHFIIRR